MEQRIQFDIEVTFHTFFIIEDLKNTIYYNTSS